MPAYVIDLYTGTVPLRDGSQTNTQFSDNVGDVLAYIPPLADDINASNVWINGVNVAVQGLANAAATSESNAAASASAASGHANRAEDAAAAAEQAAGLTPDPDFGMVVTTTSNPDVKIATFTATVGRMQDVDTSAGAFGINTPASPTVGQWFGIRDYNQQAFYGKFPWLIYGSDKIIGLSENCTIDVNTMIFTYRGVTKGWCI